MSAMTCSYVRHDSVICVPWLIFICVTRIIDTCDMLTRLIHMCDTTRLYVHHDPFICAIHTCDTTHPYVWHESFIPVTCWHDSFIRVTCWHDSFIRVSCWHDSSICVTLHIHTCNIHRTHPKFQVCIYYVCAIWRIPICDMTSSNVQVSISYKLRVCQTDKTVSPIWRSHVTRINNSCPMHEESYHTYR